MYDTANIHFSLNKNKKKILFLPFSLENVKMVKPERHKTIIPRSGNGNCKLRKLKKSLCKISRGSFVCVKIVCFFCFFALTD